MAGASAWRSRLYGGPPAAPRAPVGIPNVKGMEPGQALGRDGVLWISQRRNDRRSAP